MVLILYPKIIEKLDSADQSSDKEKYLMANKRVNQVDASIQHAEQSDAWRKRLGDFKELQTAKELMTVNFKHVLQEIPSEALEQILSDLSQSSNKASNHRKHGR